ncbi:30S ribosomal protein S17 [Candidatus Daviesbacteria bacterium]|nr:30S ribosomal protein S17 [Candidatus Daviesbacteria bacterium]
MIGRVISAKAQKTATVLIERVAVHPLYKKTFLRSKNILVHDSIGVKMGDIVEIVKVRPISKNKHWSIVKVVGKNLAEIVEAQQKEAAEKVIAEVMPEEKEDQKEIVAQEASAEPVKEISEAPKKQARKKKETK